MKDKNPIPNSESHNFSPPSLHSAKNIRFKLGDVTLAQPKLPKKSQKVPPDFFKSRIWVCYFSPFIYYDND